MKMRYIRFTLIRHGNAEDGEPDETRHLTEKGREQATGCRKKMEPISFDLVISSSAERARETATILSGSKSIIFLDELYYSPNEADYDAMEALIDQLGCATLQAYYDKDKSLMERYGNSTNRTIRQLVRKHKAKDVLIVGHAPLLTDTAYFLSGWNPSILDYNLGECEGVYIDENNTVESVQ